MSSLFGSGEKVTELKYLRCVSGNTLNADEEYLRKLKERIPGLKEVSNVEECELILLFCPVVSRAGTDIEAALKKLQHLSDPKPAVLVVLHYTFDPDCTVPDSSCSVTREKTLTVDCLFDEDRGLLTCQRNQEALDKVTKWINSEVKIQDGFQTFLMSLFKSSSRPAPSPTTTDPQVKQLQKKNEALKDFLKNVNDTLTSIIANAPKNQRQFENNPFGALSELLKQKITLKRKRPLKRNSRIQTHEHLAPVKTSQYLRCVSGNTLNADEEYLRKLKERIAGLKEVPNVEECDLILGFCPVVSRAGTDIEAALKKLQHLSDTKPAVLVVLHCTINSDCTVPDSSSRAVTREETLTVDCLFDEDRGLLRCLRNQEALDKVTKWINSEVKKHDEPKSYFTNFSKSSPSPPGSSPIITDPQIKQLRKKNEALQNVLRKVKDTLTPIITDAQKNQRQLQNHQVEGLRKLLSEIENQPEKTVKKKETAEKEQQDTRTQRPELDKAKFTSHYSELRLVLLGRTGSGMTAAGNTILGSENSQAGTPATDQEAKKRQGNVGGIDLTVLETPDGFFSGLSQDEIRNFVRLSAPGPHAFFIVIPVKESTGEERGMLEKMEEMFGDICWRNTIVLLTVTDEEQKSNVEEFIRSGNQEVQRLVEKCGNRFHCLNIKDSGDGSQVRDLLEKIEKMLEENGERFYSSDIYQEIREMEKRIINRVLTKTKEDILRHEEAIERFDEKIAEFMGTDKEAAQQIETVKNKVNNQCEKMKKKTAELEKRYEQDIKKMKEEYDGEGWKVDEKELMKIILSEVHFVLWDSKMQVKRPVELSKQTKGTQTEPLKQNTEEPEECSFETEENDQRRVNSSDPEGVKTSEGTPDDYELLQFPTADEDYNNNDQSPETEGATSNSS